MMATRRSSRVLTTTIEICPDSDDDSRENQCNDNNTNQEKTPNGKKLKRNLTRKAALVQVSQTVPKKPKRRLKLGESSKLKHADLWTRSMMNDVAFANFIKERGKLDRMIDKTELSIVEDKSERLNTTI